MVGQHTPGAAKTREQALPPAIFVTGTDTMIGKTLVSAILCKGLDAGYWKPIQSGVLDGVDTSWVREVTALDDDYFYPEAYRLTQPLSPHLSSMLDGVHIELEQIRLPNMKQQRLIVEGAGGVLVPINNRHMIIDLIEHLNIPTIVVARSQLGTINHTLLTLKALRDRNIEILGVVLNGPANPRNADAIVQYGHIPIIAQVENISPITTYSITAAFESFFGDWYARHSNNRTAAVSSEPAAGAARVSDLASVYTNENVGFTTSGSAR